MHEHEKTRIFLAFLKGKAYKRTLLCLGIRATVKAGKTTVCTHGTNAIKRQHLYATPAKLLDDAESVVMTIKNKRRH